MFKKTERLSRSEFNQFFKSGKRIHFSHATFIVAQYPERKVSVVVGKKVARLAIQRNTLRRRVYALLREEIDKKKCTGVMIVIIKPSFKTLPRQAAAAFIRSSIVEVIKST